MSEKLETEFEKMLNDYENEQNSKNEQNRKIKEGLIASIDDGEGIEGTIFIDVGEKVEGVLPKKEILDKQGNLKFKVGDKIPVFVTGKRTKNDEAILRHKRAMEEIVREKIAKKYKIDDVVEVEVISKNKGGFVAKDDEGIEFFIPRSEINVKTPEEIIGKKVKGKIIDIKKRSVVISVKKFLKEKREKFIEEVKDKILNAKVVYLKKEGMIIEFENGEKGFVPKEEIGYKKENHFKVFKKGDEVKVKLINPERLLFSIKATQKDPWEELRESGITNGDVLKVVVTSIKEYGAFVDIGNGVEGFLHISEISWNSDAEIEKLLKIGDEIEVEILELDLENRRLRVSQKTLLPNPIEEFIEKYKEGDIVEGRVINITDIGAFIKVDNVTCLLPNRHVSWTKGEKAKDILGIGEIHKFKIVSIDKDKNKIILSKKEAEGSPYIEFAKKYSVGDEIKGTIKNITDFGLFVSFNNGVEALVRKIDLEKELNEYNVRDEFKGKIIELDAENKRVKLSEK